MVREYDVTGDGYNPDGNIIGKNQTQPVTEDLDQLLKIGLFCNNAQFIKEEDRWNIKGDPTEGALLTLAAKSGHLPIHYSHWKRAEEIPFDSASGKMSVVCHEEHLKINAMSCQKALLISS